MRKEEVQDIFLKILREEEDVSAGVAAIKTLLTVIENYKVTTVQELDQNLQLAVDAMRHCDQPVAAISSGCELFKRFITFAKLDVKSFDECEQIMLQRGRIFLDTLLEARGKVAKQALPFITDGCKILTHSRSRAVLQAMLEAAKTNTRFQVYVTMSCPDNSGEAMHKQLEAAGVDATLVLDSAVGYILELVDIVMIGAEGVTESGGIINKIGTYSLAMSALQLIKVEDGLMDGEVLFHELVEKTDEEKALIKKKREAKKRLKEKRKAQQEENVKRKQKEKEELKQKALEGIKKKKELTENQRLMELAAQESQNVEDMDQDEDDAEYYRQEVGAEPEHDLFSQNPSRKRKSDDSEEPRGFKKMRLDKKLKKKFQKSQDTSGGAQKQGKFNKNREDGQRNFQNKPGGQRTFQNKPDGQRKFQNKPDGQRKFQNKPDGQRKFQNRPDGQRKFQNKPDGGKKFNNAKKTFNKGDKNHQNKKVFGGKFNKNKFGQGNKKGGKSKGKGRK